MTIRKFIQKENIAMLWEVISDETIFRFLTKDAQSNVYTIFMNNLQGFFENEQHMNTSIVDMNKKYIMLILNYIKKHFITPPNKITIHEESAKPQITFEEIQTERPNPLMEEYHRKQNELNDYMILKPPPTPKFSDAIDEPIQEMDQKLKEIQRQRKYDIENITQNHIETWHEVPTIKKVSFKNTQDIIEDQENGDKEEDLLFSKFKKTNKPPDNQHEERIQRMEEQIKQMNDKLDKMMELLSNRTPV
jgi:hypothetical protein